MYPAHLGSLTVKVLPAILRPRQDLNLRVSVLTFQLVRSQRVYGGLILLVW